MDSSKSAQLHVLRMLAERWSLVSNDRSGLPVHLTASQQHFVEPVACETLDALIELGFVQPSEQASSSSRKLWEISPAGKEYLAKEWSGK